MPGSDIQHGLRELFFRWSGQESESVELLPGSGSARRYFRLRGGAHSALGAYNHDVQENEAFYSFTRHFLRAGLPVPQLYLTHDTLPLYLLEDLGDETLFSRLTEIRQQGSSENEITGLYRRVLDYLPAFQVGGNAGLDYSRCYPRAAFDRQSMMWDLNYFKYYFLKLAGVPFNEQALENDFEEFTAFLADIPSDYFLYRDFQSRNIMICGEKLYFIDYQGGRKGPLQYDLASLLWDAKADLSNEQRAHLYEHYLETLGKHVQVDRDAFRKGYEGLVYIRILQALGAYGYRGYYERKEHFLQSIPFAVNNLKWLLQNAPLPEGLPMLRRCLEHITEQEHLSGERDAGDKLTLHIFSFSYKNGLPHDLSGNGGGFVFDCRALPNPGRYEEYKTLTGKDNEVIAFLEREPEVQQFVTNTCKLVEQSIQNYTARKFSSLLASYGCTGGQHRSVYCAEQLKQRIEGNYNINIRINHREQKF